MRWNEADKVLQGLGVEVAVDHEGQWRLGDTSVLVSLDADGEATVEFSTPEGVEALWAKTPGELRRVVQEALRRSDHKSFL